MVKPGRPVLYSLVFIFVSLLVTVFFSILYTNRVDSESNRRWCGIISTFDAAYKAQPPTTDTGRLVARQMRQLRTDFGCDS